MRFIRFSHRPAHPSLWLLCLPYAGGSPSMFAEWNGLLGPGIEAISVEFPARGQQMGEKPLVTIRAMARRLADAFERHQFEPFAVYGHSMGALVGYEFCIELRRRGLPFPRILFAAAHRSPVKPYPARKLHALETDQLVEVLRKMGGTPHDVFSDAELLDYHLPLIRADLKACETYVHLPASPLPCDIVGIRGAHDREVSEEDIAAWGSLTARDFQLHTLPGDHFFAKSDAEPLVTLLKGALFEKV